MFIKRLTASLVAGLTCLSIGFSAHADGVSDATMGGGTDVYSSLDSIKYSEFSNPIPSIVNNSDDRYTSSLDPSALDIKPTSILYKNDIKPLQEVNDFDAELDYEDKGEFLPENIYKANIQYFKSLQENIIENSEATINVNGNGTFNLKAYPENEPDSDYFKNAITITDGNKTYHYGDIIQAPFKGKALFTKAYTGNVMLQLKGSAPDVPHPTKNDFIKLFLGYNATKTLKSDSLSGTVDFEPSTKQIDVWYCQSGYAPHKDLPAYTYSISYDDYGMFRGRCFKNQKVTHRQFKYDEFYKKIEYGFGTQSYVPYTEYNSMNTPECINGKAGVYSKCMGNYIRLISNYTPVKANAVRTWSAVIPLINKHGISEYINGNNTNTSLQFGTVTLDYKPSIIDGNLILGRKVFLREYSNGAMSFHLEYVHGGEGSTGSLLSWRASLTGDRDSVYLNIPKKTPMRSINMKLVDQNGKFIASKVAYRFYENSNMGYEVLVNPHESNGSKIYKIYYPSKQIDNSLYEQAYDYMKRYVDSNFELSEKPAFDDMSHEKYPDLDFVPDVELPEVIIGNKNLVCQLLPKQDGVNPVVNEKVIENLQTVPYDKPGPSPYLPIPDYVNTQGQLINMTFKANCHENRGILPSPEIEPIEPPIPNYYYKWVDPDGNIVDTDVSHGGLYPNDALPPHVSGWVLAKNSKGEPIPPTGSIDSKDDPFTIYVMKPYEKGTPLTRQPSLELDKHEVGTPLTRQPSMELDKHELGTPLTQDYVKGEPLTREPSMELDKHAVGTPLMRQPSLELDEWRKGTPLTQDYALGTPLFRKPSLELDSWTSDPMIRPYASLELDKDKFKLGTPLFRKPSFELDKWAVGTPLTRGPSLELDKWEVGEPLTQPDVDRKKPAEVHTTAKVEKASAKPELIADSKVKSEAKPEIKREVKHEAQPVLASTGVTVTVTLLIAFVTATVGAILILRKRSKF